MKGNKIIMMPVDITITGITLLSIEEYTAAQEHIPPLNEPWWLRSPGLGRYYAACVRPDGIVNHHGLYVDFGNVAVRPALRFDPESSDIKIDVRFETGGKRWTVVGEGIALCDEAFREMLFREEWDAEDANVYEASEIKAYLEKWLADRLREQEEGNDC